MSPSLSQCWETLTAGSKIKSVQRCLSELAVGFGILLLSSMKLQKVLKKMKSEPCQFMLLLLGPMSSCERADKVDVPILTGIWKSMSG